MPQSIYEYATVSADVRLCLSKPRNPVPYDEARPITCNTTVADSKSLLLGVINALHTRWSACNICSDRRDGQLDETHRDCITPASDSSCSIVVLTRVCESFEDHLMGVYHDRPLAKDVRAPYHAR